MYRVGLFSLFRMLYFEKFKLECVVPSCVQM